MPDTEPPPLPENPQTVADLLPFLPVPYDYAKASFFAKKRDTLDAVCKPRTPVSCMVGFSGIGNASKTIRFAFVFA